MSDNKCKGIIGLLFGHHMTEFVDLDETIPDHININGTLDSYKEDVLQASKVTKNIHVKCVCRRCGK